MGQLVCFYICLKRDIVDVDIFQPFKKDRELKLVMKWEIQWERFLKLQKQSKIHTIDVIGTFFKG